MNIVVFGSMAIDLVAISDKRPNKGETVIGKDFTTMCGGKGANQAVAASRLLLDGVVTMLGMVGKDSYGNEVIDNLKKNNIDTNNIGIDEKTPTGVAMIVLAENDNSIVVVPGTNFSVNNEYLRNNLKTILLADMVMVQLETPYETVKALVDLCYENEVPIILNPAPAKKLDLEIIEKSTYLTPNEHELRIILDDFNSPVEKLLEKYPNKLIMTYGEKGVLYHDGVGVKEVSGYRVQPVDTTGAGDTFNGALAVGLLNSNKDLNYAIDFANKSAALSVTKLGAQGGMPTIEELNNYFS